MNIEQICKAKNDILKFAELIGFQITEAQKEICVELVTSLKNFNEACNVVNKIQIGSLDERIGSFALWTFWNSVFHPYVNTAVICDSASTRDRFSEKLTSAFCGFFLPSNYL